MFRARALSAVKQFDFATGACYVAAVNCNLNLLLSEALLRCSVAVGF
jgi:hypothetical protein